MTFICLLFDLSSLLFIDLRLCVAVALVCYGHCVIVRFFNCGEGLRTWGVRNTMNMCKDIVSLFDCLAAHDAQGLT